MLKRLVVVLLLVNLLFFAFMQWGGKLTGEAVPGVQPELNAGKMRLLTEAALPVSAAAVAEVGLQLAPASGLAAVSQPVAAIEKSACYEWGEFSGSDLEKAEQLLAGLKLGKSLNHRTVEYTHGYWVFIGPLKTRELVDKKLKQLKARGVSDFFVVQEPGQWQNAISLGVFKTEEAASKYLETLKPKGVRSALVGERESKLKFTVFALNQPAPDVLARLRAAHKDFPGSELKEAACTGG